ncbi:MAG: DUF1587 domain-containing protein, partial [Planctomycetota bacterium]
MTRHVDRWSALFFIAVANMLGSASIFGAGEASITQFLGQYCIDCHRTDDPSGERAFDTLKWTDSDEDTLIALQDIADQLTLGDMPPEDADQPSRQQRQEMIAGLTRHIAKLRAESTSTGGQTVLRRLTEREYLATIGDLFEMDMRMFNPAQTFPSERTVEHLDNVGDVLVTSGYLLEQYLEAADLVVEKALANVSKPESQRWRFAGDFHQQPELELAHGRAFKFRYMCLYDSPLADKPEGAYGVLHPIGEGVPHDGTYEIRVRCQALHRKTIYKAKDLRIDLEQPFRLGIR